MGEEEKKLQNAKEVFEQYANAGMKMNPPFKGFGMKVIQFAMDEPELYHLLFLEESDYDFDEYMERRVRWDIVLPCIQQSYHLSEEKARWLFRNLYLYIHGIIFFQQEKIAKISVEQINEFLGIVCRGLLIQLNASLDERTKIIPEVGQVIDGGIEEYIQGRKNIIVGYGSEKQVYQIQLEAILYFEAVGEKVFAYSKANLYEVKQRLYQIEEQLPLLQFIRISKSTLVNRDKITQVVRESSGKANITLDNGETVVASRTYAKNVMEMIKVLRKDDKKHNYILG